MKGLKQIFPWVAVAVMLWAVIGRSEVREISAINDVAGISVDPGEGGKYTFGREVAVPAKEGAFTVKSKVISVQAKSLSEALRQAGLQSEYPATLTHGSLVVLNRRFLSEDLRKISKILLEDWQGQMRPWIAVATECDAAEILKRNERENLRAGLLSAQLRRAAAAGNIQTEDGISLCSRLLAGETVSLAAIVPSEEGYRIDGSVSVKGGN
ncbi:MAG: hypothetical protein IJN42_07460 [Clostridia bacterium]|nr:hypothetical protein [Clostridia bacterium]